MADILRSVVVDGILIVHANALSLISGISRCKIWKFCLISNLLASSCYVMCKRMCVYLKAGAKPNFSFTSTTT